MLRKGTKVRVEGLVKATQHNGKVGFVTKAAAADGRVAVKLVGGKMLAARAENLEVLVPGEIGESSEATRSDANAWREVLPVVDDASAPPGDQSLASLCLEKVASSVGNMEELDEIVKSDESGTMDRLLKERRIVPEVYMSSENPSYFFPYAAHVELDSEGRHIATILSSQDKGTVQCTFNGDATKCCYTGYSPLNFNQDELDAMLKDESEKFSNDDEFAEGVNTDAESLWMRTGGAVRVSDGFLVVLHHTNPPTIRPLMSSDYYLPKHARMFLPRVVTEDSTYAVLEPCHIEQDDNDPSTWGCAGTQPFPMLVRLDVLTGKCLAYEFKRSEERRGSMAAALDYKDFLQRYEFIRFPALYQINLIEIIESGEGDASIIMSICAWIFVDAVYLVYHGRLVEEETEYGDTMSTVVWTCMCRTPSLVLNLSSAGCRTTGAMVLAGEGCKGINGSSENYDPEKHNYTDYALVLSAFEKSAPGWSAPAQRLPALLQSWMGGAAALAFSSDGKKLFAFGYDMGVPWAESRAKQEEFIEAEVHKRLGEKQEGEDDTSFRERKRKIESDAFDLWKSRDDDIKRMKLKAYCRDI